jgi:hypothetical protein
MSNPNAKPRKHKKTYSRNPQGAKGGSKSVAATILMQLEKNSASLQMPMHK